MWHHKSWFGGGWIFWIIMIMAFSGAFGNGGNWGFIVPLVLVWVFSSMIFGGKHGHHRRRWMRYDPHLSEPIPRRDANARRDLETPPAPSQQLAQSRVVGTANRSLSGLPGHCKACGGPVDGTTVEWRGVDAVCGFCGSGLKRTS